MQTLGSYCGIGVYLTEKDGHTEVVSTIKDSPAEEAGLQSGDIIAGVNEEDVSNQSSEEIVSKIKGKENTPIKLTVLRKNEYISFDLVTKEVQVYHVESKMLENNVGYIQLITFNDGCAEEFGKELVRNAGRRGSVRYADQSQPLFYQEITSDEEEVLREVLRSLGQFEGLDNFTWLELLKKRLDMGTVRGQQPLISFSKNEGLKIPDTLLGRLFSAISRKTVIRITYTVFGRQPKQYTVHPYQLKQFNDRWFLLCTPVEDDFYPFDPEFIATVHKDSLPYVQTKYLHISQIQLEGDWEETFRQRYPQLTDWTFFSIECRPNSELYARFASYGKNIMLIEPFHMRQHLEELLIKAADNYSLLQK